MKKNKKEIKTVKDVFIILKDEDDIEDFIYYLDIIIKKEFGGGKKDE